MLKPFVTGVGTGYPNTAPVLQDVAPIDADGTPIFVPAEPAPQPSPQPPPPSPVLPPAPAAPVPAAAAPKSSSNVGMIVGIVVGAVAAVLVALGVWLAPVCRITSVYFLRRSMHAHLVSMPRCVGRACPRMFLA